MFGKIKRCSKCGELKPLDEFYKSSARGRQNYCKKCSAEYGQSPKGKANMKRYRRTEKGRATARCHGIRYQERHPDQRRVKHIVNHAVENNRMPRVTTLICTDCNKPAQHYHHDDYEKPLDVVPLCQICHIQRHRR